MPGTRYDRFLDIHLVARVASGETAAAGKGVGDRKRQLGEGANGSWADEAMGGEEELL